jgi:lysophospholipase L1-like esterase
VDLSSTDTWFTDKAYRRDARQDGLYGLAGFSCSSGSTEDFGRISTSTRSAFGQSVARFDVYYLEQPNGGRLDVFVDGAHYVRISTAATTPSLGMRVIRVPEGPHELEVRPVGDGEVRLFGIVMERNAPGVVLDSLGIRGARASVWLEWDEEIWGQQLARRHPDLIMLAYGTNESGDTRQPIARYERQLSDVLARLRRISPEASCVLIGPTDRPIRRRREWVHRPRIDQVIEIQRTVGARYGCAFWDAFEAMGGALSIIEWHGMDPPLASRDRVHLTTLGYERLADELARALLSGYPPVR